MKKEMGKRPMNKKRVSRYLPRGKHGISRFLPRGKHGISRFLPRGKHGISRFLPRGKHGAEMTIGTIIIIILALVVLVVLVYGFTTGWSNLWEKITGFGGGKANVQSIVQSCQLACTTRSTYDWCSKERKIMIEESGKPTELDQIKTCEQLAKDGRYGLETCPEIPCPEEGKCDGTAQVCSDAIDAISQLSGNLDDVQIKKIQKEACLAIEGCEWKDNEGCGAECSSFKTEKNCERVGCTWEPKTS